MIEVVTDTHEQTQVSVLAGKAATLFFRKQHFSIFTSITSKQLKKR